MLLTLLLFIPAFTQTGRVVEISDGDTITVLSDNKQQKIRLAGIDAPEKGQDYSDAAKRYLSGMIHGRTVLLMSGKVDRYGRTVAKVMLDGRDNQNDRLWLIAYRSNEDNRPYSTQDVSPLPQHHS